jgi:hypothetical protein
MSMGIPIGKSGKKTGDAVRAKLMKLHNPEQLDWSRNDADLARENGMSRERLRQLRNKLGMPESQNKHKRSLP